MDDLSGDFKLVLETLDGGLVGGDLGLDNFEGDFFADLRVEGPVDLAHPPAAELFDDLVA